ncbi:GNAT family N-acetyltransferase [Rahnella perminowiae]|uniref:GNAT family N-acetyltransferase n=1 Tax=Rahnella perminowiae TaxID=2816244 RepID=UPI001C27FFDD|nr:GNAT family N-acetyltransferase [Rahnella perminowiae]MBU9828190.1 GNAT family N-acetyltransferase [Rahnella perminowiae]
MPTPSVIIRQATTGDLDSLSAICLKTSDAGQDGTALYSDATYPGLRFSVPYAVLEPDLAFVLCQNDQVVGYVVGTRDTVAFNRRLETQWWPALREKFAGRQPVAPLDDKVLDAIRQPSPASDELTGTYPAHLHINILPAAQKGGHGRMMIETELNALRAAGVSGVHLGVSLQNEQVCGFYSRLGFKFLMRSNAIYMGLIL